MPIVRDTDRKKRYTVRTKKGCNTCKERHIKCGEEKPTCFKCLDARKKCRYQDLTVAYRPYNYKSACSTSTAPSAETASVSQFSISQESKISQSTNLSQCSDNSHATDMSRSTNLSNSTALTSASMMTSPKASTQQSQAVNSISPPPSPITLNVTRELDYYMRIIAPKMDPRRAGLWNITLPQMASQSSAVQNALIAMVGYYECGMWPSRHLKMYNLAIQDLVQGDLLQVPAITRLFCCVIFIAIEWMQGNLASSTELIRTGRRMILDYRKFEKSVTEQSIFSALEAQFRTLEIHSNSHITASRHIGWSIDRMPYYEFWRPEPLNLRFRSVEEGYETLSSMLHSFVLDRCHGGDNTSQEHLQLHTAFYKRLSRLYIPDDAARSCLEIVWLQDGLSKKITKLEEERQYWDESFWDYYEFDFDLMIRLAESLDYSFETPTLPRFTIGNNITTHMFFVALRCREPKLRRRALEVIRRAGSQSGMMKSEWMIKIACRVIEFEEAGRIIIGAPDVPGEQRVIQTGLDWEPSGNSHIVKYTFKDRMIVEALI